MKTYRLSLLLLVTGLFVCLACTKPQAEEQPYSITAIQSRLALTKAQVAGSEDMLVTMQDIEHYIQFQTLAKKSKGHTLIVKDVEPIENDGLIALYVIEYESGYEILAADKRSQIPLVKEEKADYKMSEFNENFMGHVQCLAEDVWVSLYHPDLLMEPDEEAEQQIQACLDFWRMVNSDPDFIAEHVAQTRREESSPGGSRGGHWELIGVTTTEVFYDFVDHLTTTRWYQDSPTHYSPYNEFCPKQSDTSSFNCPAGCVAIAAAQMLYFLHYAIGVPEMSPSSGYCVGTVDSGANQYFYNNSSSTWNNMVSPRASQDTYAALLVGDMGWKLNAVYSQEGTSASFENLPNYVFAPYGINCTLVNFSNWDGTIIRTQLLAGMPVLCSGERQLSRSLDSTRHSFIADAYQRHRTEYTSTYEWIDDDPQPGNLLPPPIRKIEVTYSTPHFSYYRMNWGAYNTDLNNSLCSLYGYWQCGDLSPYSENRKIIYGFSALENN